MIDATSLSGLLQLSSATLPVGAFSHSLGMEAAFAGGLIHDAAAAEAWIADYVSEVWLYGEAPLWCALFAAWEGTDDVAVNEWNTRLLVSRETSELRMECEQTGRSLRQWLLALPNVEGLNELQRELLRGLDPLAYGSVHALSARCLGLDRAGGLHALVWSLLENLVMAAIKLVPLGQTAGQSMLRRLALRVPAWVAEASTIPAAETRNFSPMLAILSSRHETQYSRLFRS
ncbi:MAG: urease accessory protein UreF [Pseudomarimonas sp.]